MVRGHSVFAFKGLGDVLRDVFAAKLRVAGAPPHSRGAPLGSAETLEHRRTSFAFSERQGRKTLESQSLPVEGGTDIPFVRAKVLVSDNPLSRSKVGCITFLPAGSCRKVLRDAEPFAEVGN